MHINSPRAYTGNHTGGNKQRPDIVRRKRTQQLAASKKKDAYKPRIPRANLANDSGIRDGKYGDACRCQTAYKGQGRCGAESVFYQRRLHYAPRVGRSYEPESHDCAAGDHYPAVAAFGNLGIYNVRGL